MSTYDRVVLLSGTASAGKTSLARRIQVVAESMWMVMAQDEFTLNLLPRWVAVSDSPRTHVGPAALDS